MTLTEVTTKDTALERLLALEPMHREHQTRTHKELILEKTVDGTGPCAKGTMFRYTYKHLTRDQALQHASKRLEFEHKGEDRLNWRVLA